MVPTAGEIIQKLQHFVCGAVSALILRVSNYRGRNTMNRRITLMLTGLMFLGLATAASSNLGFAQSSPLIGAWKLNIEKSKLTPGTTPRSQPATFQQDGQNIKNTNQTIDAQGNATTSVLLHIYDGQPHPTTGNPLYDASAYLRLDANTVVYSRFKGGKLVQIGTIAVSQDGKSRTNTASGILEPNGLAGTTVSVYDKQ
jgi:hypothetical protein